jgi:RNA polymerase sigma-70 factor (ECF subfamily)
VAAEPSDEDLMRAVAEGRAEALRTLYGRHAAWVFASAERRIGRDAAEELVQDVFLGVFRAREGFDPALGTFRAWLAEATRRRIANELRRRGRKGGGEPVDLDTLPTGDPGPDEVV